MNRINMAPAYSERYHSKKIVTSIRFVERCGSQAHTHPTCEGVVGCGEAWTASIWRRFIANVIIQSRR